MASLLDSIRRILGQADKKLGENTGSQDKQSADAERNLPGNQQTEEQLKAREHRLGELEPGQEEAPIGWDSDLESDQDSSGSAVEPEDSIAAAADDSARNTTAASTDQRLEETPNESVADVPAAEADTADDAAPPPGPGVPRGEEGTADSNRASAPSMAAANELARESQPDTDMPAVPVGHRPGASSPDKAQGAGSTASVDTSGGTVTEDSQLTTSGSLSGPGDSTSWQPGEVQGQFGTLQLQGDGTWQYVLDNSLPAVQALAAGRSVQDVLTVQTGDGDSYQLAISVVGSNDVPTLQAQSHAVNEDSGQLAGQLQASDVDSGASLTFSTQQSIPGFVLNGDGSYSLDTSDPAYQVLARGEVKSLDIPVTVTDGQGASSSQTLHIEITGTDDAPVVAKTPLFQVDEGQQITGQLSATDTDTGDQVTFSSPVPCPGFSLLPDGSWSFDASLPVYQHLKAGEVMHLTVPVVATDSSGTATQSQVQISLTGTNDIPLVSGIDHAPGTTQSPDGLVHINGELTVLDPDSGESHMQAQLLQGSYGALGIDEAGHWSYTADARQQALNSLQGSQVVQEHFTVRTADGTEHQINLQIQGGNTPAIFGGVSTGMVKEEVAGQAQGQISVSDPDSGEASLVATDQQTAHGHFSMQTDGTWQFTLDHSNPDVNALAANETLVERVLVGSVDGTPHMVTINIVGTNDLPVIAGTATGAVTEDLDSSISGQLTATDVDSGDTQTWSVDGTDQGTYGSLSIDPATGEWTYHLDNSRAATQALAQGESQTESFTVAVTDAQGGVTHQTVVVKVAGSNDGPILLPQPMQLLHEGDPLLQGQLAATDVDNGETLTYSANAPVAGFTLNSDGSYTFDSGDAAYQHLAAGERLPIEIPVTVTDSQGAQSSQVLRITLSGTDDAPVVAATPLMQANEDQTLHGQLVGSDVDKGDSITFSSPVPCPGFVLHPSGAWVFDASQPAYQHLQAGQEMDLIVPVVATDSSGVSTQSEIKIHLTGTNDAPVVGGIDHAIGATSNAVGGRVHIDGDLRVLDVDAGEGHFQAQLLHGSYGVLAMDKSGHWSYSADAKQQALNSLQGSQAVEEHFTVRTADGTEHQIELRIQGSNAPAIFGGVSLGMVKEEVVGQAQGQIRVTDPDASESAMMAVDRDTPHGHFSMDETGLWHFTLDSSNPAVDQLPANQMLVERVMVGSVDGTPHMVTINIVGTNDLPVIAGTATGAVTEESTLQASGQLTISDVDAGQDHFQAGDLAGTYGTLHLAADGSWSYDLDNSNGAVQELGENQYLTETITVKAADGTTQNIVVTVNGTNDTAVIGGVATGAVTEESTLQASGQLTITDTDSGQDHFQAGDLAGTYGTLHLAADGSWTYDLDNSNGAVQELGDGKSLTETIAVKAADGTTQNIVVTVNGTNDAPVVSSAVTLPAGTEDTDVTLTTAQLLAHASDVDQGETAQLSVQNVSADHGTVTDNHDGTFTFTPEANYNGAVSFTYDVQDPQGASVGTTARMSLAAVRDAATFTGDDTGSVKEDTHLSSSNAHQFLVASGLLEVHDPDAGEDRFQFNRWGSEHAIDDPFGGALKIDQSGVWSYQVDNDNPALQSLKAGETREVVYQVKSADYTTHEIRITVTGTNDAPTVSSAVTLPSGTEDTAVTLTSAQLLAHASDVDHAETAQLSVQNVSADHGTVTDNGDGTFTFTPEANYNGPVSFTYDVQDPQGSTVATSASMNLAAVDDAAVISGTGGHLLEEDNLYYGYTINTSGQFHVVDPDGPGQSKFPDGLHHHTGSLGGTLQLYGNGNYFYDIDNSAVNHLAAGQEAKETFTIHSVDGTPHQVEFVIEGTNDAPFVRGGVTLSAGTEDTAVTLHASDLLAQAGDYDDGETAQLTVHGLTAVKPDGTSAGTITDNGDGTFSFTPEANYNGAVTFNYAVQDPQGASVSTSASLTLAAVNDAATFAGDSAKTTPDDDTIVSGKLDVTDVDAGEARFQAQTDVDGTYGKFSIDADGNWTYTPDHRADALGDGDTPQESFTVHSADGTAHTINVTLTGSNDAPTGAAAPVAVDEGAGLVTGNVTGTDVDSGDTLTFATSATVAGFTLNADGSYTFDPTHADYDGLADGATRDLTIPVTVTDQHGVGSQVNLTITVTGTNDAPVVTATSSAPADLGTTDEDTAKTFTEAELLHLVGASDVDGDTLHVTAVSSPHGSFAKDPASGDWTFTPAANFHGDNVAINLTVNDGHTDVTAHGTIDVAPVTDAATVGLTMTAEQDVILTGTGGTGRVQINNINAPHDLTEFTMEFTVLGQHVANAGSTGPVIVNMGSAANNNLLSLWNPASMKIGGAGDLDTGIDLGDGHSHRITLSWDSASGTLKVYDNGQHIVDVPDFHKGGAIPADVYAVLGGKMNDPSTHGDFRAGEHYDGQIFNTALATHALTAAEIANAPLASQLDKTTGLLIDIRSVGGHFVDTTGHIQQIEDHGLTHSTTQVDTSLAPPPPGSTLHLHPTATVADSDDHLVKLELTGLLKGTALDDGHGHTHVITGPGDRVDISNWNRGDIAAHLPVGVVQNMNVGVTATTEGPDGSRESHTGYTGIVLDPTQPLPNATITGDDTGTTDEDTALTGDLAITDADAGEAVFVATTHHGTHGDLTIDEHGHWSFTPNAAANALSDGDQVQDVFTVASKDGTTHQIQVDVTGANDGPTGVSGTGASGAAGATSVAGSTGAAGPDGATGPAGATGTAGPDGAAGSAGAAGAAGTVDTSASVQEDSQLGQYLEASGDIDATDFAGQALTFVADTITGDHGHTLRINADGHWQVRIDNTADAVQNLNTGDHTVETFSVQASDGTSHNIVVTVQGTDEGAQVAGASADVADSTDAVDIQITLADSADAADLTPAADASLAADANPLDTYLQYASAPLPADGSATEATADDSALAGYLQAAGVDAGSAQTAAVDDAPVSDDPSLLPDFDQPAADDADPEPDLFTDIDLLPDNLVDSDNLLSDDNQNLGF